MPTTKLLVFTEFEPEVAEAFASLDATAQRVGGAAAADLIGPMLDALLGKLVYRYTIDALREGMQTHMPTLFEARCNTSAEFRSRFFSAN